MKAPRGMTFIDVVVGTAIMLIVFLALFGLLRASILVSSSAKAKAGATAIGETQMEYIRSLPYDSVGTVGGIPAGSIAQNATTTVNGIPYGVRVFIGYVDDDADGAGASDTNGITTDYKRARVSVSYTLRERQHEIVFVSNIAPEAIETTVGGGTLQASIVNAAGEPVPGASIRFENPSLSPAIDVTTFSDALGLVSLPGAPTSTDYRVTVTKDGYSSAQTYARDATNQNPTPGYLTVVESQTTTSTFAIDVLAALTLRTLFPIAPASFDDSFADASGLSSLTNTQVAGGSIMLAGASGSYSSTGTARSNVIAPPGLAEWTSVSGTTGTPVGTTAIIRVLDSAGTPIPDGVLPGNSTGFSTFPVDITGLSIAAYPAIMLEASLQTSDPISSPSLSEWTLAYMEGPTPAPNVSVTLTGDKTIGSTGAGVPIYKTTLNTTTNGSGERTLEMEWDSYDIAVSGYDVVDACEPPPYVLSPGEAYEYELYVDTRTTHAALISVTDSLGEIVPDASVTLSRTGFNETVSSSSCGAAYFGDLASASDYTVTISKTGYTTTVYTNVSISGHLFYAAAFP